MCFKNIVEEICSHNLNILLLLHKFLSVSKKPQILAIYILAYNIFIIITTNGKTHMRYITCIFQKDHKMLVI